MMNSGEFESGGTVILASDHPNIKRVHANELARAARQTLSCGSRATSAAAHQPHIPPNGRR